MSYTIGAYSYILWGNRYRMPWREMMHSVLPAVQELVMVTDPRFADGTLEDLQYMADVDSKIKVYSVKLDLDDPGIDGKTKALARSKCKSQVLLQMDADEVVREQDLGKFQAIAGEVYEKQIIIGTGVINWFNGENLKWGAAGWTKERFSPNATWITHGIPVGKRIRTGRYFRAVENESDGAGYIDARGQGISSQKTLCNMKKFRRDYKSKDSFYIHHYSWYDLARKWAMKTTWEYFWGLLYGRYADLSDYERKTGRYFWIPDSVGDPAQYREHILKEMEDDSIRPAPRGVKHPESMQQWVRESMVYVPRMVSRGIFRGYSRNMEVL